MFSSMSTSALLVLTVAAGVFVSAFGAGYKLRDYQADAEEKDRLEAVIKERDALRDHYFVKAAEFEATRSQLQMERDNALSTIPSIVSRPVYRTECFDADGMRALKAAISGKGASASQPDAAVPAAK